MEKSFWNSKWEKGEIGFHQQVETPLLVEYINEFSKNINHQSHCLVPLCGKSKDLIYLNKIFPKTTGVEIITKAITDFFKENKLSPNKKENTYCFENLSLVNDDFFNYPKNFGKKYSHIFDRASLIALPPHMRLLHIDSLKKCMASNGTLLLIAIEYDQSKGNGPPFSVPTKEIQKHFDRHKVKILNESIVDKDKIKFNDLEVIQKTYLIN